MNKGTEERLKQYYANLDNGKWYGELWTNVDWRERMKEIGFKGNLESYYDLVVKFCHDYSHGGARTLPHRRLIAKSRETLMPASAVYAITSQMLGHVLKAYMEGIGELPTYPMRKHLTGEPPSGTLCRVTLEAQIQPATLYL